MRKVLLALLCGLLVAMPVMAVSTEKTEISETKKTAIRENCEGIRGKLKDVQKEDAKVRVYLGRYYEEILKNFITPLNMRLVENSLSSAELVENQNEITDIRGVFAYDYVSYQKGLEELIQMDCKAEPVKFYEKLDVVRQRRKVMEQDTLRMRTLISGHLKLAEQLKGRL